jgi:crotonobetainyl-CoA:carnitine CoA-transferase CaiB-like acyl-CoA transferase
MTLSSTFEGIRVLDLSTNIAGPFAAMILGDLGADVIKVERPPTGDDTRALPPHWHGEATVFLAVNRNKRSIVLDLKSDAGRDALLRLSETADVVIESFPPGYAAKAKLGFEDFKARNSRVILCSISAFGDGPIGAKLPGYDALVQAVSGMMSFTGLPGTEPIRIAPSVLDLSTGLWGALGIMAALARRAARGRAEHIRPSLIDSAMTLMCHQLLGTIDRRCSGKARLRGAERRALSRLSGLGRRVHARDRQRPAISPALRRSGNKGTDRRSTLSHRGRAYRITSDAR